MQGNVMEFSLEVDHSSMEDTLRQASTPNTKNSRGDFFWSEFEHAALRVSYPSPLAAIESLFEKDSSNRVLRGASLRYLLQYQHYNADFTEQESHRLGYPLAVCAFQTLPGYWRTEYKRQLEVLTPWANKYLDEFITSFSNSEAGITEHLYIGTGKTLEILKKLYASSHRIIDSEEYNPPTSSLNIDEIKKNVILISIRNLEVSNVMARLKNKSNFKKLINQTILFELNLDGVDCKLYSVGQLIIHNTDLELVFSSLRDLFDGDVYTRLNQCGVGPDRLSLHQLMTVSLASPEIKFADACRVIGVRPDKKEIEDGNIVTRVNPDHNQSINSHLNWSDMLKAFQTTQLADEGRQLYCNLILRWDEIFFSKLPDFRVVEPLLRTQVLPWTNPDATLVQLSKAYQNLCEIVMFALEVFPQIVAHLDLCNIILQQVMPSDATGKIVSTAGLHSFGMGPISDLLMYILERAQLKLEAPTIAYLKGSYFETNKLAALLSSDITQLIGVDRLEEIIEIPDILIIEIHPNNATSEKQFQNDIAGWVARILETASEKKLTLLLDATLNNLSDPEFLDIVNRFLPFIKNKKLELFCTQSLAKLIQFGSDNFSGGSFFYMGQDDEFPARLVRRNIMPHKQAYFGILLQEFQDFLPRYYQLIRSHSQKMYTNIMDSFKKISSSVWINDQEKNKYSRKIQFCATGITLNVDEGAVYVVINFESFFRYCESFQKEIHHKGATIEKKFQELDNNEKKLNKTKKLAYRQKMSVQYGRKRDELLYEKSNFESSAKEKYVKKFRDIIISLAAIRKYPITARQSFGFSLSNMSVVLHTIRFSIGAEEPDTLQSYVNIISDFSYALSITVAKNPSAFNMKMFSANIMSTYSLLKDSGPSPYLITVDVLDDFNTQNQVGTAAIFYHHHSLFVQVTESATPYRPTKKSLLYEKDTGRWVGNSRIVQDWSYSDLFQLFFHIIALNKNDLFLCENALGGFLDSKYPFTSKSSHTDVGSRITIEFEPKFTLTNDRGNAYADDQVFVESQELSGSIGGIRPRLSMLDRNTRSKIFTWCVRHEIHLYGHPTLPDTVVLVIGNLKNNINYQEDISNLCQKGHFKLLIDWLNNLNFNALPLCHDQYWSKFSLQPIDVLRNILIEVGVMLAKELNAQKLAYVLMIKNDSCRTAIIQGLIRGFQMHSLDIKSDLLAETSLQFCVIFTLALSQKLIDGYAFDQWISDLAQWLSKNPTDISRVNSYFMAIMPVIKQFYSSPFSLNDASSKDFYSIAQLPNCLIELAQHVIGLITALPEVAKKINHYRHITTLFEIILRFPLTEKHALYYNLTQLPEVLRIQWIQHLSINYWPLNKFYIEEVDNPDELVFDESDNDAICEFFSSTGCKSLLLESLAAQTLSEKDFIIALKWGIYTDDQEIFRCLLDRLPSVTFDNDFGSDRYANYIALVTHYQLAQQLFDIQFITYNKTFLMYQALVASYVNTCTKGRHGAFFREFPKEIQLLNNHLDKISKQEVSVRDGLNMVNDLYQKNQNLLTTLNPTACVREYLAFEPNKKTKAAQSIGHASPPTLHL
jgi:hypothetical protein